MTNYRCKAQYSLQRQLETVRNLDRKLNGAPKLTTAAENKQMFIENKVNRRKAAPELTTELNRSLQQPVTLSTVKNQLRPVGLNGWI